MFGGHIWELTIILGLALVVFGPKRLPEIGGALGKGIREFRESTSDLTSVGTSAPHESVSPVPVAAPVTVAVQPTGVDTVAHIAESQGNYSNAG